MMSDRALHSLRDIEGVYGSFIIDANGETVARDLPALFDDQTLTDSGERIIRLWEVLSEEGAPEYALLEFAEYSLFVRGVFLSSAARPGLAANLTLSESAAPGCLCVVVPPTVNLLALRLASKWVAREAPRFPAAS
ncbi:MAG TPA: hypothetical protein VFS67_32595 [Polyangiaceae bacterium]|nr:hypothetical protein [Polyangiaceae bacterium]